MPEYLSPAVFVEEVASGVKPIEGVGTSTAAFVGHAERGPIGEPVAVTNFGQFLARFGGFFANGYLAYAVKSFFDEGGSKAYIVRTTHYSAGQPTAASSSVVLPGFVRNGLGAGSNVAAADGIEGFRVDQTTDSNYLLSYDDGTGNMTLAAIGGASEAVAVPVVPPGGTAEVVFATLDATVVLNDSFNPAAAIVLDAATYTGVGTGALDTISIGSVTGDISAIATTTLTVDVTTPGATEVSVGAFNNLAAPLDATAGGATTVTLADGNGNELVIAVNVATPFDGAETNPVINLLPLSNLMQWLSRLTVRAESPGAWGNDLSVAVSHEGVDRFGLAVNYRGAPVESITDLSVDPLDARFAESKVGQESTYIVVANAASTRPASATDVALAGGSDGLSSLASSDYVGDAATGNGLHAFDVIDAVNIVAVPDAVSRDVHVGGMAYCAGRADCVYLADSQQNIASPDDVLNYKLAQGPYSGANAFGSKYGALYAPWIVAFDPRTGGSLPIPPSGAVAGRLAATDVARGVHKAAAGIEDGRLRSALGLAFDFTSVDQEGLNPKGINVLRRFPGVGNVIWGARTVSADPEWRYLNVRRLFLFLEESIEESTSWVVFEPNDRTLWKSLERNVSAFLKLQWLQGALVGATEEQAYYVKCNEETNPQESIDLGRVITEIGVAPSKPAEFVIFRISQFAAGSEVSE